MNKQSLENIINSPISTPQQKSQAENLLAALVPKPTPVAPTGNTALSGYYHVFITAHEFKMVNFTVVVSPEYFAELRKQWPASDPCGNEFAKHAHDQWVNVLVDFVLAKVDPEKQQLLLAPALAKFPEFVKFIHKEAA